MKLAINTRLLLHNQLEGIGWFTFETMRRITASHPEHEFIYFFDRPFHESFITSNNIEPVVIPPPARHPLLWKIWFDYSVPYAVNKHQAELFISPDGFMSQRLKIPQVAILHDLNFQHYPQDLRASHSNYYRKNFPIFAEIATRIATVSEYSKKDIVSQYQTNPDKIDVVYNGVNTDYHPSEPKKIEVFKKQHTSGADYFLFVGAMHPRKNINRLLKAFDAAKNKFPGNYKLLLVGKKYWWNNEIRATYDQMTHRDEVVFTGHLPTHELQTAFSGAIALTFVPYFEGFGIPILEAFATDCPVIASDCTAMPEIAGDAALLIDPFFEEAITESMLLLLTQPEKRLQLIEKGRKRLADFSWDQSAELLWKTIERTLETT